MFRLRSHSIARRFCTKPADEPRCSLLRSSVVGACGGIGASFGMCRSDLVREHIPIDLLFHINTTASDVMITSAVATGFVGLLSGYMIGFIPSFFRSTPKPVMAETNLYNHNQANTTEAMTDLPKINSNVILCGDSSGIISTWCATDRIRTSYIRSKNTNNSITDIQVSPDKRYAVSVCSAEIMLCLNGIPVKTLTQYKNANVAFSPDSKRLYVASSGSLNVISLDGTYGVTAMKNFDDFGIWFLCHTKDYLVSAEPDVECNYVISYLDPTKPDEPCKTIRTKISTVTKIVANSVRNQIAAIHTTGISVYDLETGTVFLPNRDRKGVYYTCVQFSPAGDLIATGDSSGTIRIWGGADDFATRGFTKSPALHYLRSQIHTRYRSGRIAEVASLAWSPCGEFIAIAQPHTGISIYRVGSKESANGIVPVVQSRRSRRKRLARECTNIDAGDVCAVCWI